ncbi:MAG: NYN domain-containing protein [Candidatus Bilamarchaeum sp.]
MEKVCILIDAGNFYHLVLKKLKIKDFDYDAFAEFLANGRQIIPRGKRFYTGTVREIVGDNRTKIAMANQNKLFSKLQSAGNWEIKTSKLRNRTERIIVDDRVQDYKKLHKAGFQEIIYGRTREKGIDVKLATDLIVGAVDNQYDTAIVISSDTDLVPAIDWVRNRMKKSVEYIGFSVPVPNHPEASTKPTSSLIARTDLQRVLVEADIRKFEIPTLI